MTIRFVILGGLVFLLSCAQPQKRSGMVTTSESTPIQTSKSPLVSDWNHLKGYNQVTIDIPHADVFVTHDPKQKQGAFHAHSIEGNPNCKLAMTDSESQLRIEQVPYKNISEKNDMVVMTEVDPFHNSQHSYSVLSESDCHYSVTLSLHQATELAITLKRGTVKIENWSSPGHIKMEWGDIDVTSVGPLMVTCDNCNLTGNGVNGPLQYQMTTGNVGMDNLMDTVDGKTLGDTVLKWRQVKSHVKIHVVSEAGDVVLSFPEKVPLAMDLQVPHGEIYSNFTRSEQGIPLSVIAKRGNIKLLRERN